MQVLWSGPPTHLGEEPLRLLTALVVGGWAVAGLFAGCGLAAASPITCEVRSDAHVAKYGGLTKDSAEHIARGELPTCDPDAGEASEAKGDNDTYDEKSRYCKRKWYC